MASPTLKRLTSRMLTIWMLVPSIAFILALGGFTAMRSKAGIDAENQRISQVLGSYISGSTRDSRLALGHIANLAGKIDGRGLRRVMASMHESFPHYFERLLMVDRGNRVVVSVPSGPVGVDYPWGNFLESGTGPAFSTPMISLDTGNLVVSLKYPVPGGSNIVGELNLQGLEEIIGDLNIPGGRGTVIITDGYGNVIAHPDPAMVRRQSNIGHMDLVAKARNGIFGSSFYREDDRWFFGNVVPVAGTGWLLISTRPLVSMYGPVAETLAVFFVLVVCFYLVMLAMINARTRQLIVAPLEAFARAMQGIAQGNAQESSHGGAGGSSFAELESIQAEFAAMAAGIEAREAALRRSERRYRTLVDNAVDGVYLVDAKGVVRDVGQGACAMLGWDLDEIVGKPLSKLDPDLDMDVWRAEWAAMPLGETAVFERMHLLKDGTELPVEVLAVALELGGERFALGSVRDVTERNKSREELVRARDEAERASRSKGEFLANMSHELRTPLNGIFGMLQLVLDSKLDDEQREYLDTALTTGRGLLAIINDVLDFSKMEAGALDMASEPFDLHACLEMVVANFRIFARDRGVEMVLEVAPDVPRMVVGDEARVRQVLFNTLGNAAKFCDQGRVSLCVSRLPVAPSGGMRLLFVVGDTGIGIPEGEIERVFKAFTQVDGASTRRYKGTGLGLGIVRRLVRLMGGTVTVDSEPGRGTDLYFTLDLEDAGDAPLAEAPAPGTIAPPKFRPLRLLLAEDELVNQLALRRFLERAGHEVACACNGREALDLLAENSFDVVLMDVQMPEMDGLAAVRAIRSGERAGVQRDVPVVALTAHAMGGDREQFLEAGMDAYLAKPVDMAELEDLLVGLAAGKAD